jgi:hypothetical protein
MFASYKPGSSAQRTLTSDDTEGLCSIYPDAAKRNVDKKVSASGVVSAAACDPTPRHGFGSTCASNPAPKEGSSSGGCAVAAPAGSAGPKGDAPWSALAAFASAVAVVLGARVRKRW